MKNILVPTDLTERASNAYYYAQELSEYLDATIKVLHVAQPNIDPKNPYLSMPLEYFMERKKQALESFVNRSTPTELEQIITAGMTEKEVIMGYAAEEIIRRSNAEDVDLIVMGTTGKSNAIIRLFGSVSTQVVKKSGCPVLLVPQRLPFKPFKHILYASNYEAADDILLSEIADLAEVFDASIHLVHVNETKMKGDYEFEELILQKLFKKRAPQMDFKMTTVHSENICSGLNQYAEESDIDLIVIAKPHRNFWKDLIHQSITRKMVLDSKTPILILPLNN